LAGYSKVKSHENRGAYVFYVLGWVHGGPINPKGIETDPMGVEKIPPVMVS
jgi:hypothetical protein